MNIAICDDERLLVESLASVLRARGHDVHEATHIDELAELLEQGSVDLCVVDLVFGSVISTDRLRALLGLHPDTLLIVYTGYPDGPTIDELWDAGVANVLSKGLHLDTVLEALEAGGAGRSTPPRRRRTATAVARSPGPVETLTPREHQVLVSMARGQSTDTVARRLHISPATARSHLQNVLRKLGAHSRLEAVATAFAEGVLDGTDLHPH